MTMKSLLCIAVMVAGKLLLVNGYDGCEDDDNYACGDKCGYYCECGVGPDKLLIGRDLRRSWCCQDQDYSCPAAEHEDLPVYCTNATVIPLTQSCNGRCNFHINDTFRNHDKRSHYPCADGEQCVLEENLCQGNPLCQDQSDLATCSNEKWVNVSCPFEDEYSRCNKTRHGQCIPNDKLKDNVYDCFDRSDEEPYLRKTESPVNWSHLINCIDTNQSPGIFCNGSSYPRGDCIPHYEWCKGEQNKSYKCDTGHSTNNVVICSNFTFWENQTCELFDSYYETLVGGSRCNGGNSGECIFPKYEGNEPVSRQCLDKSDQVHLDSIHCPDMIYNKTQHPHCIESCYDACPSDEPCLVDGHEKCEACLDPANCRGSCAAPGPSCEPCTKEGYFKCSDSKCINPFLHCDGHPHCSDGLEDEDLDTCEEEYRKRNIIQREATYKCNSTTHPELYTLAIACDGIPECFEAEDEKYCLQNLISPYLFVIVILALTIISMFVHWVVQRVSLARSGVKRESFEEFDVKDLFLYSLITGKQDEESKKNLVDAFRKSHEQPSYGMEINVSMIGLQALHIHRNERIELNKKYYEMELAVHDGNVSETALCLKKNINWQTCGHIFADIVPGFLAKYTPEKVKDWIDAFKASYIGSWVLYILLRIGRIASIYFDIIKDILLFVTMIRLLGGPGALARYPANFSGQIVFILIASIFTPLIASGIMHAIKSPFLILGFKQKMVQDANPMKKWQKKLFQCGIVVCSFLNPVMLQNVLENETQNMIRLVKSGLTSKKQMALIKEMGCFCSEIKRRLLEFRKGEFAMEVIFQLATQMSMLMLNDTLTATTSGLETIFKQDSQGDVVGAQVILTLSIIASFVSAASTSVKIKKLEKDEFLSMNGKIITGMRSLMTTVLKVGCLVLFFTPFLGQLNILAHWKGEQIPFRTESIKDFYFMVDGKVKTIPFKVLNRMDNSTAPPTPPPYSLYTQIELARAYILLLCLLFVQMLVTHGVKYYTSKSYKNAHFVEKLVHVAECLTIPSIHSDWDKEGGSLSKHRQRWRLVWREICALEIITWLSNITLVLPIIVTGVKIRERHLLLVPTVGVFNEEIHAYNLVTFLMWVLPLSVTLVSILDLALFHFYNMNYHPWKMILMEEESGIKKRPSFRVKRRMTGKQGLTSQQQDIIYYSHKKESIEDISMEMKPTNDISIESHTNQALESDNNPGYVAVS